MVIKEEVVSQGGENMAAGVGSSCHIAFPVRKLTNADAQVTFFFPFCPENLIAHI